jgi:hypothetical protein
MATNFFPYQSAKRDLTSQYGASASRNAYAQFLARTRGNRKITDVKEQYGRQFPGFVSNYQQRGLAGPGVQSGIYQQALSDFAKRQFTDVNTVQQGINDEINNLRMQQQNAEALYKQQLAELELQKARDIANQAALLNSFKPFIGG